MGLMACDKKGNSVYNVTVPSYPLSAANYPELEDIGYDNEEGIIRAACERYGAENVYYYRYDWRLDPFTHAKGINALVRQALSDSGKSKVNLVCCSMGGIETLAYISEYGSSKLNRVIFVSSTFCGTHVTTDVLRGIIEVDPFNLYMYARQNLAKDSRALALLFDGLYKAKVFDAVSRFANNWFVPKLKDRVYDEFLSPVFGTMPSVWALVLPEGYKEAVKYMFGGKEKEYADFIALTKRYQDLAASRAGILKKAEKSGTSVCVIASYNCACIPVYPGGGGNGDNTLESDRILGGAAVAKLGSTLGESYVPANPAHLSPDRVVDLSCALFPESTWAICGSPHVACSYGTDMSDFLFWAVDYSGRLTVNSSEKYPQFMKSSYNQELSKW
jgi:pimeloyl-ACP methyl ester carboxylesterase